jgi:hypothetical protein
MRTITAILFLYLFAGNLYPQDNNTPVPFTLGDRDRLMRNEQKIDAIRTEMGVRFESIDKQIDVLKENNVQVRNEISELRSAIYNLIYSIFGLIGVFIAVLVWDRCKI